MYFEWLSHLSWFKYGNEALLINQWQGVEHIQCLHSNTTCPANGHIVLEALNFHEVPRGSTWLGRFTCLFSPPQGNFYLDIGCLVVLIVVFRFIAFLFLLAKTYRNA